jgi:aryl-alcohol dehydrogenase-like predicted oxidoreductase
MSSLNQQISVNRTPLRRSGAETCSTRVLMSHALEVPEHWIAAHNRCNFHRLQREWNTMQRTFTRLGRDVFPIGLGAMPLSLDSRPDERAAQTVIAEFLAAGGDFIDTANVYCRDDSDLGHNERLIQKVLNEQSTNKPILVATKGGLRRPRGTWTVDGSPAWLRQSCEQSLRDLQVESIQLYQLHAVDPNVDIRVSLDELQRLQVEGKIVHIGLSNVTLGDLQRAATHVPIVSVQNRCNPCMKKDFGNDGVIDYCKEQGLTYIAHSPVGGHFGHSRLAEEATLQSLAVKYHASPYQIALAWLLAKGEHIVPIPGASRVTSILDSLQAVRLQLQDDDLAAIDALPDN